MKLSRRELLQIAAGTAAVGGLGMGLLDYEADGAAVSRTTGKDFTGIPSTCLNCYARCGIVGYVEGEYLHKIGGNPEHPNSKGRMCAKGQAGLNMAKDPDRVLYPMRREGPRGKNNFKRISWDSAISEIAEKLNALKKDGHPEGFVFQTLRDITTASLIRRFLYGFGSPNALVNNALGKDNNRLAQEYTWGEPIAINDVGNCRYILNFGSNPYEAHLLRTSFVQRITEGRVTKITEGQVHYGAKMVTFDVRCSQTAGKSDEWHPIFPGTDGLVALAMANVIMEEGWYDADFINNWTNVTVDELKQHLAQYSPLFAAKVSGVPEEDIRRIALEFSQSKPATTISTGGVSKHANGFNNERCIMLLNAICGNIDVKGGYCLPRNYEFQEPSPVPPKPTVDSPFISANGYEHPHDILKMVKDGEAQVKVFMTYQHNAVYANPDVEMNRAVLGSEDMVPFYVAIDDHFSEGALYADIILPCSNYLERMELESPPSLEMVPFVSLRQPIIPPPGECKSITEILVGLAQAVSNDMALYFNFTPDRLVNLHVANIPGLVEAGGLEYLKQNGLWYDKDLKPEYQSYLKNGFKTPSGKFEIKSQRVALMGFDPLPTYQPISEHEALSDSALVLTTYQWNVHTHFSTANAMWLSEIQHNNPAWINSKTATLLGIETGDTIEVKSKTGVMETTALVTEGVHPGVIAISDSLGHWELGHIARAENSESEDPNTRLIWWHKQGAGNHPNVVIPVSSDPIGGGQAWMDTVVEVKKLRGKLKPGFGEKYFGFLGKE